ncbi:MAG TPA: hypothetical protein VH678_19205 [Xanthobacteraceae bacterium]|jgi:hypothetical protein
MASSIRTPVIKILVTLSLLMPNRVSSTEVDLDQVIDRSFVQTVQALEPYRR